jgi:hypothetical protein
MLCQNLFLYWSIVMGNHKERPLPMVNFLICATIHLCSSSVFNADQPVAKYLS